MLHFWAVTKKLYLKFLIFKILICFLKNSCLLVKKYKGKYLLQFTVVLIIKIFRFFTIETICGIFIPLGDFAPEMPFEHCCVRKRCVGMWPSSFENDSAIKETLHFSIQLFSRCLQLINFQTFFEILSKKENFY